MTLSICGSLVLMGFHRVAFDPSPQQNHLGGRGDLLVHNFLKMYACYRSLDSDRYICTFLTYPENLKKIYNLEKSYGNLFTKMWPSVKIF